MDKLDDVSGDGFADSVVRNGIMFLFELAAWYACILLEDNRLLNYITIVSLSMFNAYIFI